MERTKIGDLRSAIGQEVKIKGWLQILRDQKNMQFLVVRDNSGAAQIVSEKKSDPDLAEIISGLGTESAVTVTGMVVDNPVVKLGGLEIQLKSLIVENKADTPLPFEPFGDTLPAMDYRMDWRYIDMRRSQTQLIFKFQTTVEQAMREYWLEHGFTEMHSPKLMGSPSESGAELFELEYFDTRAFLAQSPQFYKQMAMAAGYERIFEISPVFRADPSFTSRHMTEFTSVDMEMSWIDSHEDVMQFVENWLQFVYKRAKEVHGEAVAELFDTELVVPEVPFPRITMDEANRILKEEVGYELPPEKKVDLDPGGERAIGQYVKAKYGHEFVFLTDWAFETRPFYHMVHPENPSITRSFDLLCNGLELVTGAQREHRYDVLAEQAKDKGLGLEPIQFYLDFFRYGCPPHGGIGLGLSRLMMVMLNLPNIREAVFLFRGPNRLHP